MTLRGIWNRLVGGGSDRSAEAAAPAAEVEYKGFTIRPAPIQKGGQWQTAGVIQKTVEGEVKEHRFIRADTLSSRDEAEAFSLAKGKQIVDEQGDRVFGSP